MSSSPIPFPRRRALGFLALLCFAVLIFSYLLTLTIALVCLALPVLVFSHDAYSFGGILLAGMGLIIGGTILWSLLPRRDNFKLVGVEIDLASQPRLKRLIEDIAAQMKQRTPDNVYLIPDANAFVMERDRRRIMGLGLPLIANMSTAAFSGVLTHEFAHYYSGDTRLGPRVYRTRNAMARAIQNLGATNPALQLLSRFAIAAVLYAVVVGALVAYWKLFMRFTQLVSRQQEYRSDELACCVVGPAAMADGLRAVTMIGAASPTFWRGVIDPVLTAGYVPPLADGFARYLAAPAVREGASRALAETLKKPPKSPYDTHPALNLRLERIARMPVTTGTLAEQSPALALLNDLPALEGRLLAAMAPKLNLAALKPTDWDSAAQNVWLPIWRKTVAEQGKLLGEQTIAALPELARTLPQIGSRIPDPPGRLLTREQRAERASNLVWMALAIRLHERGWTIHMQPGQFALVKGNDRINPPESVAALRQGKTSAQAWAAWCARRELTDVKLAGV